MRGPDPPPGNEARHTVDRDIFTLKIIRVNVRGSFNPRKF